jgi:CubicO group peptidase (beta-lactamase class C family)
MAESLIPMTLTRIEEGRRSGQHSGAQIYIAHQGKTIVDMAVGESHDGIMMSPDTLFHWLSSTKPIAAVVICQLWERGLLAMDDLVYHHIPEFGIRGKEKISIRHILTHTAGIRGVDVGGFRTPWDETIRRICAITSRKKLENRKKSRLSSDLKLVYSGRTDTTTGWPTI